MSRDLMSEVDTIIEAPLYTTCLLCGESIPVYNYNPAPRVCEDCKSLWKSLKSIRCDERVKQMIENKEYL